MLNMLSVNNNLYLIRRSLLVGMILLAFFCVNSLFAAGVAEYLMEEGAATVAGDTSGSANNSYFVGQPVWQAGHGGGSQHCLGFDGSSYLEAPHSASMNNITTKFTMTAWIKPEQNSINDTIVWKLGAFRIWKHNAFIKVTLTGANVTDVVVTPSGISNGIWQHIAVTYNGQRLKCYVNGVSVYNTRINGSDYPISASTFPLRVGWYNGGPPHYRGLLDNVRVYDNELLVGDVIADMSDDTTPTQPLAIVQSGLAATAIVIPTGTAIEVETVAANELQYHIKQATGVTLGIYQESSKPTTFGGLIYVGACNATAAAGINGSYLDDNFYVVRNVGSDFFLAGKDNAGNPLGMMHVNYTRIGTMLAVYRFLEQYMHVKWLWPGPKGEVIPTAVNLQTDGINIIDKPVLKHPHLIDYNTDWGWGASNYNGWTSAETQQNYLNAQSLWLRRQGFCKSINLNYGEAFGTWWDTYHTTHPEYFNLLPDGTRRSDPYYVDGRTDLVSMNLSDPNFHHQIVDNWIAAGASGYIACAENDTATKCTCPTCMAWDVEPANFQSEYGCPWSQRLIYATNAFNTADPAWYKYLGPMSDRLAKYLLAVQQEAANRGYPNAILHAWSYANYVNGPLDEVQLNDRIVIGVVPAINFPWTDAKQQEFRDTWDRWANNGAKVYLRPNYLYDGHNLPINYARRLGSDFLYALRRGLFATTFDTLTGQWSTQSLNFYTLARIQTHVNTGWENWGADVSGDGRIDMTDLAVLSNWWLDNASGCQPGNRCGDINGDGNVDLPDFAMLAERWHNNNAEVGAIIDEFYDAFGPAKSAIQAYFEYWEAVSDAATISPLYYSWFVDADQIFTPSVMATGRALMTNAQVAATGDPVAVRLVDFLEKGFTNAEKTLAAQAAWENLQNTPYGGLYEQAHQAWHAAYADLLNYRASVEADFICNMGVLNYWERSYVWINP